jgi:hypothetical protein
MEPERIPELIAQIALADPRVKREDKIERRAQALMWAGILADVPYDFAVHAAHQHYVISTWPILPAEIATRWQAVVRDRMNRHTGTFEPTAHPELDPDDIAGYQQALRAERHAVVMGQQPPNELKAITAGPAAADVERRMAELGTYLPPHVRDALKTYRPVAAEREQNIRAGRPDPLAVPCPVDTCRAATGRPCTRPSRGDARRRLNQPHPSRIDHAAKESAA